MADTIGQMREALGNLRTWMRVCGDRTAPTIHPDRVAEAIAALDAGITELNGETPSDEVNLLDDDEILFDEDECVRFIQQYLMDQGVAAGEDEISAVLQGEQEYYASVGLTDLVWKPDDDGDYET